MKIIVEDYVVHDVCVCVCGCVCVAVGQAWYGELLSQIVYVSRLVCRGKSGLDVLRMSRI